MKKLIGLLLLIFPMTLLAQVAPATRGGQLALSAGAEYSNFQPDFGLNRMGGVTVFANLDHIFLRNLGAEGEARWLRFNSFADETESHYLLGPRYRIWRFDRVAIYGKLLMGGGFITYPLKLGSGSYFAYAPGGTVEYQFKRRWVARGDYEYQRWPSAPGLAFTYPNPSHGLTPNGFSVGVSYRIF